MVSASNALPQKIFTSITEIQKKNRLLLDQVGRFRKNGGNKS